MDIKRTEYAIFVEKRGKWAKLTEKVYNSSEKAEEAAKSANLTDKYRIMSRVVLFDLPLLPSNCIYHTSSGSDSFLTFYLASHT